MLFGKIQKNTSFSVAKFLIHIKNHKKHLGSVELNAATD